MELFFAERCLTGRVLGRSRGWGTIGHDPRAKFRAGILALRSSRAARLLRSYVP